MVYIKKVEIHGFKSFGFTNKVINLEKGLVCITGPNGSGKSNILDAIAFALGENSPKALRVDKLHSLFYDNAIGNNVRRNVRVSVTFDNSDKGIPLESNTVTITREMPFNGDSIYLLNGKHVSKSTISDLLEVALATPNRLNNVQQGMIMRIAELNSEERRKIIEDIIGLSYFDKKKEEAMKQLEEADRKLEVALARMGEIRKRIDELEIERNNQLRYNYLDREIKRLNAIKISNLIREQRRKISELDEIIAKKRKDEEDISKHLAEVREEISKLEVLKNDIIKEVDKISKSKAEINKKISDLVVRLEQSKAIKNANEQRIKTIGSIIPALMKERKELENKLDGLDTAIKKLHNEQEILDNKKKELSANIKILNDKLAILNQRLHDANQNQNRLDKILKNKTELLASIKTRIELNTQMLNLTQDNLNANRKRLDSINNEIKRLESVSNELKARKEEKEQALANCSKEIDRLSNTKSMLTQYIDKALEILEDATKITAKYDARINAVKEINSEEYDTAMLLKESDKIIGIVKDLIRYDELYAKAVIALAYDWLNAIVVRSVSDAIEIIEKARVMNLSRIKVIPLEIVERLEFARYNGKKISELVTTEYKHLADFVLDGYLATSSYDARRIAEEGYTAVTLEGQVFNAKVSSLRLSNTNKLRDLTKMVILTRSIDDLKYALSKLHDLVIIKREQIKIIEQKLENENKKMSSEQNLLNEINLQIDNINLVLERYGKSIANLEERIKVLEASITRLSNEINADREKEASITQEIDKIKEELNAINKDSIINEINLLTREKENLKKSLEETENSYRGIITQITTKNAEFGSIKKRLDDIGKELENVKREAREKRIIMINASKELVEIERGLREAREEEQRIIDTSNSITRLKEYDDKIREAREEEKRLTRQLATIERDLAINTKERNDLAISEERLSNELSSMGYKELISEEMDVDNILKELTKEYNTIKDTINQLADKSYKQLIEGYRGVSERRNQLEAERNSIVKFIEDIDSEKKKIFMDSFEKIDRDIRHIFATMTDNLGSAWLEIEDPDNIFEHGLALMIQFPNKPPRESTSLSGGEKTIAAITFLLALQSLKPSPYYLFDEVDAHLDAQNTERLLKILIERSKFSQMIVVTLKDVIVAHANLVYGVYAKNGVSNVIKYKSNIEINAK